MLRYNQGGFTKQMILYGYERLRFNPMCPISRNPNVMKLFCGRHRIPSVKYLKKNIIIERGN